LTFFGSEGVNEVHEEVQCPSHLSVTFIS